MNEPACRTEGTCRQSEFCRPGCVPADSIPTIGEILTKTLTKKPEARKNGYLPELFCKSLSSLNDPDRGAIVAAVVDYDFNNREPVFLAENLQSVWNALKRDIDRKREEHRRFVDIRRQNGKRGGRPRKKATGFDDKATGFEAEKATGFGRDSSCKSCNYLKVTANDKNINNINIHKKEDCQGEKTFPDFRKWTIEQFQRQIDNAIALHPEFEPYRQTFLDYWTQPKPNGKPRFAGEPAWDTVKRLRTFDLNEKKRFGNTPQPVKTESEIPTMF